MLLSLALEQLDSVLASQGTSDLIGASAHFEIAEKRQLCFVLSKEIATTALLASSTTFLPQWDFRANLRLAQVKSNTAVDDSLMMPIWLLTNPHQANRLGDDVALSFQLPPTAWKLLGDKNSSPSYHCGRALARGLTH